MNVLPLQRTQLIGISSRERDLGTVTSRLPPWTHHSIRRLRNFIFSPSATRSQQATVIPAAHQATYDNIKEQPAIYKNTQMERGGV
ncbi:hypothetical protein Y1Q_0024534 [Alligator mississippiensis]|uniref:Uncharacterized protein n=1 Tax=Alligator mississippiensis TaxID=8496 RepID=A0A151NAW6_ALLMI|nr:hypothetical protein Y1Q_0024534 [Alligator mississippiensis]